MKIAVIQKRTTYRKFVVEEPDPLLAKLLARKDPTVVRLQASHDAHEGTMEEVDDALAKLGANVVYRGGPRGKLPSRVELVVTVGGDGTLLAASHQLGSGVPILGINSAPHSSIGFFCGGKKGSVLKTLRQALEGELPASPLSRMRVDLNGQTISNRVLNEALFCHASPAATTRYLVLVERANGRKLEADQRSSGMWIGPAAGSTAAQRSAGGKVLPLMSKKIQYVVREFYRPIGTRSHFGLGLLGPDDKLTLRSKIRDGRVFIDGLRIVHAVTIGDVLVMTRSNESVTLLGLANKRRS